MAALFDALTPAQKLAFLEGPALAPPLGVLPQFSNPPNQNAMSYGIVVTGIVLAALAVVMRLYARLVCTKKMRLEDCKFAMSLCRRRVQWADWRLRYDDCSSGTCSCLD